jgi:hypothetical protein
LLPNWRQRIVTQDGLFQVNGAVTVVPEDGYVTFVESTNVILIETATGTLTRRTASITLEGQPFTLKPPPADRTATCQPTFLYTLLVGAP